MIMQILWFTLITIIIIPFPLLAQGEVMETGDFETKSYIQSIDEVELYYQITGSGPDTIVVIHGGPGMSIDYLEPDLEPLAEKYTLIYYDQRSAGKSSMIIDSAALHLDKYVADLEAIRQYFGINRLNLLGHSWGAVLGARYVRAYPDNVSRLVMVSPGAVRNDPYDAMFFPRVLAWMDKTQLAEFESLHKSFIEGKGEIRRHVPRIHQYLQTRIFLRSIRSGNLRPQCAAISVAHLNRHCAATGWLTP
jgi:pimeloyl-ACP methyl ester carboxylesterase